MITIIIPALNEEKTIAKVVNYCWSKPLVSEIIVVDDQSFDKTVQYATEAGARVITSTRIGKGASMKDGMLCAQNEIIVFLDGDIDPYPDKMIEQMTAPLIHNEYDFIKATFSRNSGRVTELVAKPLLSMFFPALSHYSQPLSGMIAGRKSFFEKLEFFNDYGVDVGILIDMHNQGARITEINIGYIENDSKPLHELGKMSKEVASAIIKKAFSQNNKAVSIEEFQSINIIRDQMEIAFSEQLKDAKKMVVFDMDDTILKGRFVDCYANQFGLTETLLDIRKKITDSTLRTKAIAQLFKGRHFGELIEIINSIALIPDVQEVITKLHERGYVVGIITDSYDFVANHIKNKIGADFFLANELEFSNSNATGEVKIPSFFFHHDNSSCLHTLCKSNALDHILQKYDIEHGNCMAIGDSENDICMVKKAGFGVAFRSKNEYLKQTADLLIESESFSPVLAYALH
ncbi:HAD-IB family phosphatase [Sediminibacterium goheungense]|uniref:Phosphoserine phosphatase SerB n=1 Tax=Sediminibacterium goheungense TaxID=1086393 RepID=A0A4V3C504_9BACT|nr:HAD-IB family phosphatase [Sediminibacterium goheungense]TDO27968.1 phosphoserine phosphatase SerB [Sediminibacterium goheungense]